MTAPTILPPTLSAYLDGGEGAAREARPVRPRTRGRVIMNGPRLFAADEGYPVSGDKIARHLDSPHDDNGTRNGRTLRRHPFGDLLWPAIAATPHPGRD